MYKYLLLVLFKLVIITYISFTTQNPASFELISNHPLNKRDQRLLINALNNFAENLNQYERTIENIILKDKNKQVIKNLKSVPLEKTKKKKVSNDNKPSIKVPSKSNDAVKNNGFQYLNQRDQENYIDTNNNYMQTNDLPYNSETDQNQYSETSTTKNNFQDLNTEQFYTLSESNQETNNGNSNTNENTPSDSDQNQNDQPFAGLNEDITTEAATITAQSPTSPTTQFPVATTQFPVAVIPVYTTTFNTYGSIYYRFNGCYHVDSPNYDDLTLYHKQTSSQDLINKCKATFMPNDFIVVRKNCYDISTWQPKYTVSSSNDCLNEYEQKCNLNSEENCYGINMQSFAFYSVNGASLVTKNEIIKTKDARQ